MGHMQGKVSIAWAFYMPGVREVVVKLSFTGFSLWSSLLLTLFITTNLSVHKPISTEVNRNFSGLRALLHSHIKTPIMKWMQEDYNAFSLQCLACS